jgi:uncharacterized protein (UPF0276 family)
MPALVGGSIRKTLGPPMLEAASHWPVCEVVPENWNPDDASEVAALTALNETTEILLHSLSLNVLGPAPAAHIAERARRWSGILGLTMVTDHFCWSATDAHTLGVFVPPIEKPEILRERVRAAKDAVGLAFGLENISLSSDDPDFSLGYHQALAEVSHLEDVAVLLDVENLRLDSIAGGIPVERLLSIYDAVEICGYHVAGSTAADPVLDTHDQRAPRETLELLLACYSRKPRPVIYERDYALDLDEIADEVRRIADFVDSGGTLA